MKTLRAKTILLGFMLSTVLCSTLLAQTFESVYTPLGNACRTAPKHFGSGKRYTGQKYLKCPGIAGYNIFLHDGLLRLVTPKGQEIGLPDFVCSDDCFPYVSGSKIEWRIPKNSKIKLTPHALIVRLSADSCKSGKYQTTSYLAVVKIDSKEICFTDQIPPGLQQNELAQKAADLVDSRPCQSSSCEDNALKWCHNEGEPCGH